MSETSEKLDHTLRAYGRLERKHGERGRELTAVKAERDAYREMLVKALDEYVDHQSWRCGHPPHYYLVERSEQGYEGCPCGLDEFCKRARSVLAGVVSTREKDK